MISDNMKKAQFMIATELMRDGKLGASDADLLALKITMRLSVEHMDMFNESARELREKLTRRSVAPSQQEGNQG